MVQVARERIDTLFARAEEASRRGFPEYADRYVRHARRIGTRYNVRLPPALRDRFCRECLSYFQEGTTVRTRLRHGRRSRTCLRCGRTYRRVVKARRGGPRPPALNPTPSPGDPGIGVPVDELGEDAEEPEAEVDEA